MNLGINTVSALALSFSIMGFNSYSAGHQSQLEQSEILPTPLSFIQKEITKDTTHIFTKREVKQERKEVTTTEKPQSLPPKPQPNYKELTVEATAYVSFCDTGCIGITARGTNVQSDIYHPTGLKIIATDPRVIPLGSIVEINGEKYIADDTGGDIKGNRIDILVAVRDTVPAYKFGRQTLNVKVFN